jgi:hypothetical protein
MARTALVAAAIITATLQAPAAILAASRPALRLTTTQPLRIHGRHFVPGERVRVRATSGGYHAHRSITADGHGGFDVTFASVIVSRCSGLSVIAVGTHRDQAALLRRQLGCAALTARRGVMSGTPG